MSDCPFWILFCIITKQNLVKQFNERLEDKYKDSLYEVRTLENK